MQKDNSNIRISVVIPAYNEEKYLPACLRSLKKQVFRSRYEIIVVDNNSTDNTAKIARKYGSRVIKEKRRGVCFARQTGTVKARGDIVVSTDADSIFPNDWLQNVYQAFNDPKAIAVLGPFEYESKPKWSKFYSTLVFKIVQYFFDRYGKIIYVAASNFAFRKYIWEEVGGYNTALTQGGDEHDFLIRIRKLGYIAYLKQNKISTSSRRMNRGLIYNIFISLIGYYIIDCAIAKFTGKSFFGQWPAYRETTEPKRNWFLTSVYTVLWVFMFLSLVFGTGKIYAKGRYITGGKKVFSATKEGYGDIKDEKNSLNHWHKHSYYTDENR